MAEHRKHEHQAGGSDPRQHNRTSTGRGESASAREETEAGERQASTSSGRGSSESDAMDRLPDVPDREPNNQGLTMGTNGGERIGAPPEKKSPGAHTERRPKAS